LILILLLEESCDRWRIAESEDASAYNMMGFRHSQNYAILNKIERGDREI
jgi:hypothetical protein